MLLSYNRLCKLVEDGVITNVSEDMINSTSIDLTLGDKILVEGKYENKVSLRNRDHLDMNEVFLNDADTFRLYPGKFILACTQQMFNLPNNISGEYKLKSSMARIGLEHLNAGWCDAGWNNSVLTLEFRNMTKNHIIELRKGDKIGQIVFWEHEPVPANKSYAVRGRYNNHTTVMGIVK